MSIELKVKVKHLAEEARIIKREERKVRGMERWKLQHHRKTVVRDAARRALIAYLICRGKPHEQHWKKRETTPAFVLKKDGEEVDRMVRKYSARPVAASVEG